MHSRAFLLLCAGAHLDLQERSLKANRGITPPLTTLAQTGQTSKKTNDTSHLVLLKPLHSIS